MKSWREPKNVDAKNVESEIDDTKIVNIKNVNIKLSNPKMSNLKLSKAVKCRKVKNVECQKYQKLKNVFGVDIFRLSQSCCVKPEQKLDCLVPALNWVQLKKLTILKATQKSKNY